MLSVSDKDNKKEGPSKKSFASLTVQAIPPNAQVRILNIKPRYKPGMILTPGKYRVEVSAEGYWPKELCVEIVQGQNLLIPIRLEKHIYSGKVVPMKSDAEKEEIKKKTRVIKAPVNRVKS